ncbi:MAG: hypothetical protein K2W81_15990 [Sphingomonas sp.]|nr:hypothetical protein [Sphingomonas sp.]
MASSLSTRLQSEYFDHAALSRSYAEDGIEYNPNDLISGLEIGFGLVAVPIFAAFLLIPVLLFGTLKRSLFVPIYLVFSMPFFIWAYLGVPLGLTDQQGGELFWGLLAAITPMIFLLSYLLIGRRPSA